MLKILVRNTLKWAQIPALTTKFKFILTGSSTFIHTMQISYINDNIPELCRHTVESGSYFSKGCVLMWSMNRCPWFPSMFLVIGMNKIFSTWLHLHYRASNFTESSVFLRNSYALYGWKSKITEEKSALEGVASITTNGVLARNTEKLRKIRKSFRLRTVTQKFSWRHS